jgi:hypothetical protein
MKIRTATSTIFAIAIVSFALVVQASSRKSGKATPHIDPATDPCPNCRIDFGMFGIIREQTARVNVVLLTPVPTGDRSQPIPVGDRQVQVELSFFDSQGNLLLRSTETLMEGHAAFLDLNGATLFPPRGVGDAVGLSNRAEIRGGVHVLQPVPEPDRNTVNLVATVEVFDNDTGKTSFGLTPVPAGDRQQ